MKKSAGGGAKEPLGSILSMADVVEVDKLGCENGVYQGQ